MAKTIRVSLCDKSPAILFGLKQILSQDPEIDTVVTTGCIDDLLHKLVDQEQDILMVDIEENPQFSLDCLKRFHELRPDVKIIVFTTCNNWQIIMETIKLGVQGFLLKDSTPEDLIQGVHTIYNGGTCLATCVTTAMVEHLSAKNNPAPKARSALSNREQEVLDLLARGKSNNDIADSLLISPRTVKFHVSSIFTKLNVKNRTEAAAKWVH